MLEWAGQQGIGLANRLVASEAVVIAAPDPNAPFSYQITRVLWNNGELPPITLLVDSVTRRRYRVDGRGALFLWRATESRWERVGHATSALVDTVDDILEHRKEWTRTEFREQRWQFFADALEVAEPRVTEMALSELAEAPQQWLRRAQPEIPRSVLRDTWSNPLHPRLHPLMIRLLALNPEPTDERRIREAIESISRSGHASPTLLPLAEALIEIDGAAAVTWLAHHYFQMPSRRDPEMLAVLQSLSNQGHHGRTELRGSIAEAYGILIRARPEHAAILAADLMQWEDWRFADLLSALGEAGRFNQNLSEVMAIRTYVARARSFRKR